MFAKLSAPGELEYGALRMMRLEDGLLAGGAGTP
jgi:hypothetical protein